MKTLQTYLVALLVAAFAFNSSAQCPASISSLGVGNGLQICWPRNEAPVKLDSINYDGVTYTGHFVNAGQGDCWRTDAAATLGVNGNHTLEVLVDGLPGGVCEVFDGTIEPQLPIKLAYFGANLENDAVLLDWQTMEEENNDFFQIERSTDAIEFKAIAQIDGAGTVNEIQFYEWRDEAVAYQNGTFYYRLKQVDTDGSFTYSEIVVVSIENASKLELTRVFPNPATDEVNVLVNLETLNTAQLAIIDMTGRVLLEENIDGNSGTVQNVRLNIADLQSGCYMLRVQSGQTVKSVKLIKA